MATRRGIAPREVSVRSWDRDRAAARPLAPAETAWLLVLPALALALAAIVVLGPPLGRLAFSGNHYTYWPSVRSQLHPKPAQLARFVLAVACSLGFAALIPVVARRAPRMRPARARSAVLGSQLICGAIVVLCFAAQSDVNPYDIGDPTYFAPLAIVVACALAGLAAFVLASPRALAQVRAGLARASRERICLALAVLVTIAWLLPSIFTDANVVYANRIAASHLQFTYDEAMSVLDGRSPLVNMATYGALIPYLIAPPLAWLGAGIAAFTTLMVTLTAGAMVAVYASLRRLTRNALAALLLYVPFVATSLFIVRGDSVERFTFGTYFGMFPVRYAGPYALAWLTVRHLDGERPRSATPLFAAAGLVVLNNADFGLPALGATLLAVLCARPPRDRQAVLALAARVAAGLAVAFALVSALTLARAGTLPHLDRLFAYARLFGTSGYENLPTPVLGFHLVILATFLAAVATAGVRLAAREADAPLTGMLAWCGVFGLGTGGYFVYRSHPDTLIASFSIWALTTAVLVVALVRGAREHGAVRPSPAAVALLAGFGLAVCSLAQMPLPWQQVARIARTSPVRLLAWQPATRFVSANVRRGETVAILTPLGHRIGYELGVTNVMAYTGMTQMPTEQQLQETVDAVRAAGGRLIFLGEQHQPEVPSALAAAGFQLVAEDPESGFTMWRDARP